MSSSRRLPKFDSAHFETLSHEEKLALLNRFLDALNRSQASRGSDREGLAREAPLQVQKST